MLIGNKTYSTPAGFTPSIGELYFLPEEVLAEVQAVAKLVGRFETLGSGVARVRPVIYTEAGALVCVGEETVLSAPLAEEWVDLPLGAATGQILQPGGYRFGYWVGGSAGVLQVATDAGAGTSAAAAYSSTALPPAAIGSTAAANPALFAVTFAPFAPPVNADDMTVGRFGWEAAQRTFENTSGPQRRSRLVDVTVGWHGVNFDVETGAFAIARTGGACEEFVGRRIKITRRYGIYSASIAVYCYAQKPFPAEVQDEDLSLTRRAFLGLSGWEQDSVDCDVEVME